MSGDPRKPGGAMMRWATFGLAGRGAAAVVWLKRLVVVRLKRLVVMGEAGGNRDSGKHRCLRRSVQTFARCR